LKGIQSANIVSTMKHFCVYSSDKAARKAVRARTRKFAARSGDDSPLALNAVIARQILGRDVFLTTSMEFQSPAAIII